MFAFDLLHLDDKDLRRTPLLERPAALRNLSSVTAGHRSSSAIMPTVTVFLKAAADLGLEGIVSKRRRAFTAVDA
jgi:bifunctional non-homologous end joining protein LigD